MSLVAAFVWTKSPRCSISTMIYDDDNLEIVSKPRIQYFSEGYFSFRRYSKNAIKEFFTDIERLQKTRQTPVIIEYKIVFNVHEIPYLAPAKESKFVHKTFNILARKLKSKVNEVKIRPQLRSRLSGKPLKHFKRELRTLHLVSRRRDTGFEYLLWSVALHATAATYLKKLQFIRNKLVSAMWEEI